MFVVIESWITYNGQFPFQEEILHMGSYQDQGSMPVREEGCIMYM